MAKKKKIILMVTGSLVLLIAAMLFFGTRGMDTIRNYAIAKPDLNSFDDGVYKGAFAKTRWALAVEVTVKGHRIKEIRITDRKHSNITKSILDEVNGRLIATDNPDFDALSGASMTSKGYLIAVADALKR
jgi:uncharacterized protein with FMN-binding domain